MEPSFQSIQTSELIKFLNFESYFIVSLLVVLSWLFYRFLLKKASPERHQSLQKQYRFLSKNFFIFSAFFAVFTLFLKVSGGVGSLATPLPYLGAVTFILGSFVFVKTCRLIVLQYLFLGSMQEGVPLLVVNIFSLVLSVSIFFWAISHLFGVQLTPILATSAAFSIVLGLAMQDTLGNLFAGISLQIDKSFEIGDWLEVIQGNQRIVGQVKEISWRATTMVGWTNETIVIPNRTMANSQIFNFQSGDYPIYRAQMFRLAYGTNLDLAQEILLHVCERIPEILKYPPPACFVTENHDSWLGLRLSYAISSYGLQFVVGHMVIKEGLEALRAQGIQVTHMTYLMAGRSISEGDQGQAIRSGDDFAPPRPQV